MAQARVWLFVFVAVLAAPPPAVPQTDPAPQVVPVLDNVDLMDCLVKPAYDSLRLAVAHPAADWKGIGRRVPAGSAVGRAGKPDFSDAGRRVAAVRVGGQRRAGAGRVGGSCRGTARAAQRPADDVDRVREAFPGGVRRLCTACHRAFARECP